MLVLYAVTRAGAKATPDTERLVCERVAVVHRSTERAPGQTRPELLAFADVIADLARRGPVLPVRFGTTVPSPVDLHALASANEDAWAARLDAVEGKAELVVHVTGELAEPGAHGDTSGREYLLARARLLRWRSDLLAGVSSLLGPWAVEQRTLDEEALRLAVLVPKEATATVSDAIRAWGADLGVTAEVTGPWPPFSFCAEGAA